ncbi:MAG: vanadium-dependent haloperoxidase [Pyrinomonadaceae bacterium]
MMYFKSRSFERLIFGLLFVAGAATLSFANGADIIKEWNIEAARLVVPSGPPVHQTRLMAIHQIAVHDAVNGITRRYHTYLPRVDAPDHASPEAAAIAASYYTLCSFFPTQCDPLYALFVNSLAANGLELDDPGIPFGATAAQAILDARADDGAGQAQFVFDPVSLLPGVWHPRSGQTALRPGWGAVRPFVLERASQFRPKPPPGLGSRVYLRDLEEVRILGRLGNECTMLGQANCRTTEQTAIAVFWRDGSPVNVWNQPMRHFASLAGFDISTAAWAYAMLNITGADSGIACWEAKYGIDGISGGYNFWRPQSAINYADGNASWVPVHTTPPHPEYPAGHTTNSSAMASMLAYIFGDYPGEKIAATVGSATREWDSFTEAADEVIDARVYSGIHFRHTDEIGARQGKKVARYVWNHTLKPCRGKGKCK